MVKDIEKAYLEEQDYLAEHSPYDSLFKRINKYGFENLEEYFKAKADYQLSKINFNIYTEDSLDIDKKIWATLQNGEAAVWAPNLESDVACVGVDNINEAKAAELNVRVLHLPHMGGIIISGPDDLTVGIHFKKELANDAGGDYFFKKMYNFLIPKGFVADGNDFLYDGKKVIGCSGSDILSMNSFFFSASFSDHLNIIQSLCTKEMKKVPGVIPAAVLTRDELFSEVKSWLNE